MFANMAALKAAVSAETARNDATFSARIGEFVTMGEARIFNGPKPLRCREMETRNSALAFTAGVGATPANFLQAKRLTWNSTPARKLVYRTPEQFYDGTPIAGLPRLFTVDGTVIDLAPTATGTATLSYYAKPTALIADGDSNPVLVAHGHVYLFAALIGAYTYLRHPDKPAEMVSRLAEAIDGVNGAAIRARHAGTHLAPMVPGAYRA